MTASDPILQPNPEMIKRYFDIVFGYTEGWIALRGFPEKKGSPQFHRWVERDHPEAINRCLSFAHETAKSGTACYVIPGTVKEKNQAKAADIYQMQTVLVDLDHGDIEAKRTHLTRHLGIPALVVASGGITSEGQQKLHIYWKLQESYTGDDLNTIARVRELIACKAGGDQHFKSLHQPIRVAGSIYHKNNAQKLVTIIEDTPHKHDLGELLERAEDMPYMEGEKAAPSQTPDKNDSNAATKFSIEQLMMKIVREGGVDGITRFGASSHVMGHWLRLVHEGKCTKEEAAKHIIEHNEACLRPPRPYDDIQHDIKRLWSKHVEDNGPPKAPPNPQAIFTYLDERTHTLGALLDCELPTPEDLIGPRLLPPGEILVLGGAPKAGKSDLLMHMLVHAAAGKPFLSFGVHRPLRVFYMQTEVGYHYLKERLQSSNLNQPHFANARDNLFITERLRLMLNEEALPHVIALIKNRFGDQPPDVLAFDPLRNLFDGGADGRSSENDNNAMVHFLTQRIEVIQKAINPQAGVIIAHHTRKMAPLALKENPFEAFAGASSLRGFYSTGLILARSEEDPHERILYSELRNGPDIGTLHLRKLKDSWIMEESTSERLAHKEIGRRLDKERSRRNDVIVSILRKQALKGKTYIPKNFAEKFENKCSLGSKDAILKRLDVLITKGYIKFFKNSAAYGVRNPGSKFGLMCVEDMVLGSHKSEIDEATGEVLERGQPVIPTHYRCPQTRQFLEITTSDKWVYDDDE